MMRPVARAGLFLLLSTAVVGQQGQPPKFDVADVHVRPHSSNATPYMTGGVLRADRYDLRNATMLGLITTAYGVDADTVLGGPNWLDRDRFDIIAKAPPSTPADTLKLMLQDLLAERFKLVLHKDTKPVPSYALTVASGKPKLKEASAQGDGECQTSQSPVEPGAAPLILTTCHGMTMEAFGEQLHNMAGGYFPNRVADLTGLKGAWDFELKWSPRALASQPGGISLYNALEQQLGLKVGLQNVPAPVLVVDSVNQKPTDNPSGVAQNLPSPPPAEFDVADIKLSPPEATPNVRLQPGGRIDLEGITMKLMIQVAWDIQNDDELIAGGPKWLDSTKYSMIARASAAVTGSGNNMQIDTDDLRLMLQALLKQRFKLVTHFEDRPVNAYTLVADKPKLQPADPANRTKWINGPAPGAKDPRDANPILNRFLTFQNFTMAQFAEDLPRVAGGYIKEPVVDATGLTGAYDFTLSFTGVGRLTGPGGRGGDAAAAGATPMASDPTGGLSLFDAVQKQLGVKLELRKRPMPVLVIDSVQEKPSDN
jgi:uncharacterized protein (TIGR03435 family)